MCKFARCGFTFDVAEMLIFTNRTRISDKLKTIFYV
jgi:hypothetical protein